MVRSRLIHLVGFLILAAFAARSTTALAQSSTPQSGYIEIHGSGIDGASVFLGNKELGKIAQGRLLVPDVYPGTYKLRIEMKPYFPREITVTVQPDRGVAVTVGAEGIDVQDTVEQSATANGNMTPTSASVRLTCYPMECSLQLKPAAGSSVPPTFGTRTFQKMFGQDAIVVSGLPQGQWDFEVTSPMYPDKVLKGTRGLCNGDKVDLTADFSASLGGLSFGLSPYPDCKPLKVQTAAP